MESLTSNKNSSKTPSENSSRYPGELSCQSFRLSSVMVWTRNSGNECMVGAINERIGYDIEFAVFFTHVSNIKERYPIGLPKSVCK